MNVLFVGDRPSKLNTYSHLAFIGTPSFRNLKKWIEKMQVFDFYMVNSFSDEDFAKILAFKILHSLDYRYVALGENASKRLTNLGIEHFKLPHPSPKNRKLNNKRAINILLKKCTQYLKDGEVAK